MLLYMVTGTVTMVTGIVTGIVTMVADIVTRVQCVHSCFHNFIVGD